MLKKINPIDIGSTVVMVSKYENMVRTGTIQSPSSFLNAVLTSYSKKYRSLNIQDKENYTKSLRKKLSEDIEKSYWLENLNPNFTLIPIQKKIRDTIIKLYRYHFAKINDAKLSDDVINLYNKVIKVNKDYFDSIFSILPLKVFDKEILTKIFEDFNISIDFSGTTIHMTDISKYKKYIGSQINLEFKNILDNLSNINELKKDIYDNIIKYFDNFITNVLNFSENIIFSKFCKDLSDTNNQIEVNIFNYIGNYFQRNIFFINSNSRSVELVDKVSTTPTYSNSILLLRICNNHNVHYESVGIVDHNHKITREFRTKSDLIQMIIEQNIKTSNADIFDRKSITSTSNSDDNCVSNNSEPEPSEPEPSEPEPEPSEPEPSEPEPSEPEPSEQTKQDIANEEEISKQDNKKRSRKLSRDEQDDFVYQSDDSDNEYTDSDDEN